jgi:hypothetical protein
MKRCYKGVCGLCGRITRSASKATFWHRTYSLHLRFHCPVYRMERTQQSLIRLALAVGWEHMLQGAVDGGEAHYA